MRRKRDPRINVGYVSIREYLVLFLALAVFNGFQMWIARYLDYRGMLGTYSRLVFIIYLAYVMSAAAWFTIVTAITRHVLWNRPMRKLNEATRNIASGDFSFRITPLRKDGKKDYLEVMFDDFNTMAQELMSIETLKNDFIASVSHEIKTPLSIIQGYATALQNDKLSVAERDDCINTIIEASGKLSTLVSNILKLNKLENERILPMAHSFDLGEQLRRCALAFEDIWEAKNINFELELEETMVYYDESLLEIVWNNLIYNAIKFSNPGGSIFIKLKAREDCVQVSINDTGCGMDEETKKHIFDKFYQGDSSRSQEGNGLGLALVKRSLDLLGGTVTVVSLAGEGSTFTVSLKTHLTQ